MNSYQQSTFNQFTTGIAGFIYQRVNTITAYLDLKETNEVLAGENARLKTLNKKAMIQLQGEFVIVDDTLSRQQYKYLDARAVKSTVHSRQNIVIINRGMNHGVEPEMAVTSPLGAVGVVRDVAPNFATVIPIINQRLNISAQLEKNGFFGILQWGDHFDPTLAMLKDIPKNVAVEKGDRIVTKGASAIFPEGIALGIVKAVSLEEGENFLDIEVQLAVDFRGLSHVYVVKNLLKKEMEALETTFNDNE